MQKKFLLFLFFISVVFHELSIAQKTPITPENDNDLSLDALMDKILGPDPDSKEPKRRPRRDPLKEALPESDTQEIALKRAKIKKELNTLYDGLMRIIAATQDITLFDSNFREQVSFYQQTRTPVRPPKQEKVDKVKTKKAVKDEDFLPTLEEVKSAAGLLSMIEILLSKKAYQLVIIDKKHASIVKKITQENKKLATLQQEIDHYVEQVKAGTLTEEELLRQKLLSKAERLSVVSEQHRQAMQEKLITFYKNLQGLIGGIKAVFKDPALRKAFEAKRKERDKAARPSRYRRDYDRYRDRGNGWPRKRDRDRYRAPRYPADDYYPSQALADRDRQEEIKDDKDEKDKPSKRLLGKKKDKEDEDKEKKELKAKEANALFTEATKLLKEVCQDIPLLDQATIVETTKKVEMVLASKNKQIERLKAVTNEIAKRPATKEAEKNDKKKSKDKTKKDKTKKDKTKNSEKAQLLKSQELFFTTFTKNAGALLTLGNSSSVTTPEDEYGRYSIVIDSHTLSTGQPLIKKIYTTIASLLPKNHQARVKQQEGATKQKVTTAVKNRAVQQPSFDPTHELLAMNIKALEQTVSALTDALVWTTIANKLEIKLKGGDAIALKEMLHVAESKFSPGLQNILFNEQTKRAQALIKKDETLTPLKAHQLLQAQLADLQKKGATLLEQELKKEQLSIEQLLEKHILPSSDKAWKGYPDKKGKAAKGKKAAKEDNGELLAKLRTLYRQDKTTKVLNELDKIQELTKALLPAYKPQPELVRVMEALWSITQPTVAKEKIVLSSPETTDSQSYVWQKIINTTLQTLKEELAEKTKPFSMPTPLETKVKADLSNLESATLVCSSGCRVVEV